MTEGASRDETAITAGSGAARARRRSWWFAALFLCALFAAIEHRAILGQAVPMWDARDLHAPNQILVADHARAGRLLFWNPWTQGGSPDFADPQAGAFSPVSIGLGLLTGGSVHGFTILWLTHWLLGGLGILALAARLGAAPAGALVPAIGWLYCGVYMGQAQHVPILISFSYLPWILVRLDVAVREGRVLPAVQAGALWGLSALYGYPAMTILNPAFGAAWAVLRWRGAWTRRAIAIALGFGVVGAIILAPAYAAILREPGGYSDYIGEKSREVAIGSNALEPSAIATLASPYWLDLKHKNRSLLWPRTNMTMTSLYCGALTVSLALFAALGGGGRSRFRLAILALAALSAALALGDGTPLRGWLYDFVPPTRFFRHSALFRVYTMLSLVVLAICGTKDLWRASERGDWKSWRRFSGVAGIAAVIAIFSFARIENLGLRPGANDGLASFHVMIIWISVALFAVIAPMLERRRRGLAALGLVVLAAADATLTQSLTPTIYNTRPAMIFAWRSIDSQHSSNLDLTAHGLARSLETQLAGEESGLNVALKLPTLKGFHSLKNRFLTRWLKIPTLSTAALEMEGGRPRTWFAREAPETPWSDAAWESFAAHAAKTGSLPLVVHHPDSMRHPKREATAVPDLAASAPAEPIEVDVLRYVPEELAFDVESPAAGWLLVTDRWSQSWRATVDGEEVPIFGGDFLFRAIRVHAGLNRVRFSYEPTGYLPLVAVSWGTLAVVAAFSIGSAVRTRTR